MKYNKIIRIVKTLFLPHVKTPLGRWNIHNNKETILKIKYATEDNCYISYNKYKNHIQFQNNNEFDNNEYIYMMGFESVKN